MLVILSCMFVLMLFFICVNGYSFFSIGELLSFWYMLRFIVCVIMLLLRNVMWICGLFWFVSSFVSMFDDVLGMIIILMLFVFLKLGSIWFV